MKKDDKLQNKTWRLTMKYFLILIMLSLYANSDINTNFKKDTLPTKALIKDRKIINAAKKLQSILKSIKEYKRKKNNKIKKLEQELQLLKRRFKREENRKDKKIQKLKKALSVSEQKVKKKQNELFTFQKNKKIEVKNTLNITHEVILLKQHFTKEENKKNQELKKELFSLKKNIQVKAEEKVIHNAQALNLPKEWIRIVVRDHLNIYDLALKYYGDSQEYTKIYTANKDVINSNYQINDGMSLIIPMTGTFQEQPMMLNNY